MTATRVALGVTSLSSCSRLPLSSWASTDNPVTLPPGRARLATKPAPTGSPVTAITMGIVSDACLAAWAAKVLSVTIMSTFIWTSSVAMAASLSGLPCAKRNSRTMFWPST